MRRRRAPRRSLWPPGRLAHTDRLCSRHRSDRVLAACLAAAALGLIALDQWHPIAPGARRADFGATAAIAIASFIGNLFSFFSGRIDRNVKRALEGLRDVITGIGRTLIQFIGNTAGRFADVFDWLKRQWRDVLVPALRTLDRHVRRFFKWLHDTLSPLIQAIVWLRTHILKIYDRWLRPIFDTIEMLRRILSVFSFFGMEWSRKLDAKLAELEAALRRPIAAILDKLNDAIGAIDRIATANGLLQRLTLVASLVRDQRYLSNLWWNAQTPRLTEAERAELRAAAKLPDPDVVVDELGVWLETRGGIHAEGIDRFGALVESARRAA